MNKKILFLSFVFGLLSLVFCLQLVSAQVPINTTLPGLTNNGGAATNPCSYIFSFYTFALMIGGILAFGAIVYGGVKYTMAAGNPSGQSEGKEWVKGALLGLLLLVGAYLILNVVNPDIVKCTLPTIGGITNGTGGSGQINLRRLNCGGVACLSGETECYQCGSMGAASSQPQNCAPPGSLNGFCTDLGAASGGTGGTTANVWQCPTDKSCYWANDSQTQATCTAGCNGTACVACPVDSCTDGTSCNSVASPFPNCQPTTAGVGTCLSYGCTPSAQLNSFIYGSCLPAGFQGAVSSITGDQHTCDVAQGFVSCHFGGKSCVDGGHAVDFGWNAGLKNSYPTLWAAQQALQNANCPNVTTIRCEYQGGAPDASCTGNNHIHVNIGSCGCG